MKNKIRKAAKYVLDHPYEIAYYTVSGVALYGAYALAREKKAHAVCHDMARWMVLNVKHVPEGTKQHIWTNGKYYFIEAIED